ncbi:MAG: adenosine deaminase [Candidatus Thorarchaeota archaeon]|nr:adenosine deaminase [Candidatus Thorarchaeota archaeon]
MELEDAIKALPKAEHHVHLLGAIKPSTLMRAITETGIDSPYESIDDIERAFEFKNFAHFISVYKQTIDLITEEKYFEPMAYELLEKSKECNVKYVEISFSAPDHTRAGLDFELMMKAIERGVSRGYSDFGVKADIRIDIVRSYGLKSAMESLDLIESRPDGIVSIDIGGSEKEHPPEPYSVVYDRAREMGLHTVAHAGEAAGPHSIWGAVKHLGVERIGHGVAAIHDETLMTYLEEKGVTIESCPVSNVRTKVVSSLREHPIRTFFDRGLSLTVNSDDPTFFETDMNNEYIQLNQVLGFTLQELFQISLNAIQCSFIDEATKQRMDVEFRNEYSRVLDAIEM